MSDGKPGEDRSMSEILASIRKIVSDEETTRRAADDERRKAEATSDPGVLVLSGDMRPAAPAATAGGTDEEPLDLSAAKQLTLGNPEAAKAAPVEFSAAPGLSEDDVERIVRRVIREELQGPIGQQISRKVKSLIREEVSKALGDDDALI